MGLYVPENSNSNLIDGLAKTLRQWIPRGANSQKFIVPEMEGRNPNNIAASNLPDLTAKCCEKLKAGPNKDALSSHIRKIQDSLFASNEFEGRAIKLFTGAQSRYNQIRATEASEPVMTENELPGSEDEISSQTMALACPIGDPIYSYDKLNRRITMTTPAGTTEYQYDLASGRLAKIIAPGNKVFEFSYEKGDLAGLSMPNGINASYAFDSMGNLRSLEYKRGGTPVRSFSYTYNPNGLRTSMTDVESSHNYTYDALNQILSAAHPQVQDPLEKFAYDVAGNRLYGLDSAFTWQYNSLNQLIEDDSATYAYDADGNMVLKVGKAGEDTARFSYSIENKLVEVEKPGMLVQYAYDALDRRVRKSVNSIVHEFRYDGEDLVLEMDAGDSILASYTYGPGVDWPLAMERNGESSYYLRDGLGSVTALTDDSGNVIQEYRYGAFGNLVLDSGGIANPFTYTGREWEPELGLYYYRARFYDPRTGRFMQEDPIKINPDLWIGRDPVRFTPEDVNAYAYVRNTPLNLTDPSGECPWCIAAVVGGLTDLSIQLAFNGFNLKCIDWKEVAVSAALSGVGVGIAQKLGKVSTVFGGPNRPTYRLFKSKGIRVESHPISKSAPNWYSYPHWHPDFAGKPWSKLHFPLIEPLVGIPAAGYNALKDGCECQ